MLIYYFLTNVFLYFALVGEDHYTIYIVKNSWHVGIIMETSEQLTSNINVITQYEKFKYVDIGWGDANFYQSPDEFDLILAAKAIFLSTPSVLRIQGYHRSIHEIVNSSDFTFEVKLNKKQYESLCEYVNNSFAKDSTNQIKQASERFFGSVRFYSSIHKYHLTNTCNTWVARALIYSGFEISSCVITSDDLLIEIVKIGKLLKLEN